MELKSISRKLVIAGTLLIWLVKFIIRPIALPEGPIAFVLGILPNLAGSFLIPFGAYWFFQGRASTLARLFRIQTTFDLTLVCLLGFALLVVNEYLQKLPFFGRTFDYFDILFSSVGLCLSWFVFIRIRQRVAVPAE